MTSMFISTNQILIDKIDKYMTTSFDIFSEESIKWIIIKEELKSMLDDLLQGFKLISYKWLFKSGRILNRRLLETKQDLLLKKYQIMKILIISKPFHLFFKRLF